MRGAAAAAPFGRGAPPPLKHYIWLPFQVQRRPPPWRPSLEVAAADARRRAAAAPGWGSAPPPWLPLQQDAGTISTISY